MFIKIGKATIDPKDVIGMLPGEGGGDFFVVVVYKARQDVFIPFVTAGERDLALLQAAKDWEKAITADKSKDAPREEPKVNTKAAPKQPDLPWNGSLAELFDAFFKKS